MDRIVGLCGVLLLVACGGGGGGGDGGGEPRPDAGGGGLGFERFKTELPPAICTHLQGCGFVAAGEGEACRDEVESELGRLTCAAARDFYTANQAELDGCLDGSEGTCANDDPSSFCPALGRVDLDTLCGGPPDAGPMPLDCLGLARCVGECLDDPCIDGCASRSMPEAVTAFVALATCIAESGCAAGDSACVASRCADALATCRAGQCSGLETHCDLLFTCCAGSSCITADDGPRCRKDCASGTECASGCCVPTTTGGAVCVAESYCDAFCRQPGESCSANPCCLGATCVSIGETPACQQNCSSASQCSSGCCAPLESGGSVCVPSEYCAPSCVKPGDKCRPGECCPGSVCVFIDYVGPRCQVQSAECPANCGNPYGSNCCRPPFCGGDCVGSPCCN